jgi:hypothetical protein
VLDQDNKLGFSPRTIDEFLFDQTTHLQKKKEQEKKALQDKERVYQSMFKPKILGLTPNQ